MKIKMVYLAAGNSRRFGSNKLYHEIGGRPMFRHGLEALFHVLEENWDTVLTVVTEYSAVRDFVLESKKRWGGRLSVVGSPEREKGISYSIRAGIGDEEADYYLFCVADQPWISHETVLELIKTTTEGGFTGGYVSFHGVSGNPAMFSKKLLPELMALSGDTGGKKILRSHENVCTVQAKEPAEMKDIDENNAV